MSINALSAVTRLALMSLLLASPAMAQEHDHGAHDDHDGPLHFAHPIFTESPSPDTKLRLDYLIRQITADAQEHSMRVEAEYAFTPSFSIEANIPVTSRRESGTTANAVGTMDCHEICAAAGRVYKLYGNGI